MTRWPAIRTKRVVLRPLAYYFGDCERILNKLELPILLILIECVVRVVFQTEVPADRHAHRCRGSGRRYRQQQVALIQEENGDVGPAQIH